MRDTKEGIDMKMTIKLVADNVRPLGHQIGKAAAVAVVGVLAGAAMGGFYDSHICKIVEPVIETIEIN
jgi:outer membrane lipoprotein SlyB